MTVTFDPAYPLFAGQFYQTSIRNSIEDMAGNRLSSQSYPWFYSGYSQGTDPNTLPTGATVVVNPERLYADGETTARVTISNINRNGTLVPNGTKIGVTVDKAYNDSSGGGILGGITSISDPRFKIFEVMGGSVTFTYRSANRSDLSTGITVRSYIQVASVDAAEVPASLIASRSITLFRGNYASFSVNPRNLLANGSSYSDVEITVYDSWGVPVPAGNVVGVTVQLVYIQSSAGGIINGGVPALDERFKIFDTITGGYVDLTYTGPFLAANKGATACIQAAGVYDTGVVIYGLLGYTGITLNGSSGYTAPQPKVINYSPFSGQSYVGLNTPVVVEFSQPIDPATLTASNFSVSGPAGAVSGTRTLSDGVNGADTRVTFVPSNPWVPNSSYSVFISTGIKSKAGNPLLDYVQINFSTGVGNDNDPPVVVMINPVDGASGIAINSHISVRFDEVMDPGSVNINTFRVSGNGTDISGRVVRDSYTDYSFIPDNLLEPDTLYTVTLTTGVTDAPGNHLTSAFTSSFTTQTGEDNFRPSVVSITPANGSTNVNATTSVVITFSEPMNPLTFNSSTSYIGGVNSNISLAAGNTILTITPVNPLFAGTRYYVYLSTGIMDTAGNSLSSNLSYYFTTDIKTNTGGLPNSATITINPPELFANGKISTTVIINNINNNGIPVPNGTIVGVLADPSLYQNNVGGIISGSSIGTSIDSRFMLFETLGASVTLTYTPPDLDWLTPGSTARNVIWVASTDIDTRPVQLIANRTATLFRINDATITANPTTLPANGVSQSTIDILVRDYLGNLVPDGTKVGLTTANIYSSNSAGGTITGGITSPSDERVQVFTTVAGRISAIYQSPGARGSGNGVIQVLSVDNMEMVLPEKIFSPNRPILKIRQ